MALMPEPNKMALINSIHNVEDLRGCSIGLYHNGTSSLLHNGIPEYPAFHSYAAIVEISALNSRTSIIANQVQSEQDFEMEIDPSLIKDSQSYQELAQAGISCGFAILSGISLAGATAAAPVTGGLSLVVTISLWGGAVTSAAQCGNGLARALLEQTGKMEGLKALDENAEYGLFVDLVDSWDTAFGWMGIGGAAANYAKHKVLKNALGRILPANFSALTNKEKKKAVGLALRELYSKPGGEAQLRNLLSEVGLDQKVIDRQLAWLAKGSKSVLGSVLKSHRLKHRELVEAINKNLGDFGENLFLQGLNMVQNKTQEIGNGNQSSPYIHIDVVPIS